MNRSLRVTSRLGLLCACALLATTFVGTCMAQTTNTTYPPIQFTDHAQEIRFQELTSHLRCLVCQNESLAASQADLAKQMRHLIIQQMNKGWTNEQIKQYLVERYSDYVLYKPPLRPSTWLLWFGPGVIILFGAAVVIVTVRKRKVGAPHSAVEPDDDDDW